MNKHALEIPLSLYIHFPWCIQKCPYCDFNSHALKDSLPEQAYIEKLLQDLQADLNKTAARKIYSIFMGGGTPSVFSPAAIACLLKTIRSQIDYVNDDIEITLEANPGTIDQEKFAGYRAAGVNRLSIGVQSFQTEKLQRLGRIHDATAAQHAIMAAKHAGFENFNIDLMHGLPAQQLPDAISDLQTALEFKPPHLSWYQLTLEPNTAFHHQPPVLPNEEILDAIQQQGQRYLQDKHYQHYEVSAYCQRGFHCQHNTNYWEFGDYLGIGAGAHEKITDRQTGQITRYSKIKHPRAYLAATDFIASTEIIRPERLPFEFMLNALRLQKPLRWQLFYQRTGLPDTAILPQLEKLQHQQLLYFDEKTISLTTMGRRFLNDVLTAFL